ncbi:MAG: ABC transporter permease [Ruminococcus sp.]|nr:ABC transporter permease [Ruminococcus sp.]
MQVFNAFLKVLKKRSLSAMIYIAVFLGIAIPMASSSNATEAMKLTSLDICVFDEDGTDASRELISLLAENNKIVTLENDRDVMTDALYYEWIDYALIIDKGYAEKLAAGETNDLFRSYHMHDSYSVVYVTNLLSEYTSTVKAFMTSGNSFSDALSKTADALSTDTEVTMKSFSSGGGLKDIVGFYYRYLPYILVSVILGTLCPVIVTMNSRDLRFRTSCSSIRSASYTMQLFLGSAIFVFAVLALFTVVGIVLNGGINGDMLLAVANSIIFSLVVTALTVFVSGFEIGPNIQALITQIASLGMSFLCGVFVPQSMLGGGVLAAARFLPMYWYTVLNDMLMGDTRFDAGKAALCLAVEAAFAVMLVVLTVLVRRQSSGKNAPRQKKAEPAAA